MTYNEGFAIAQRSGLEEEFSFSYMHSQFDDTGQRVLDALREWDLPCR